MTKRYDCIKRLIEAGVGYDDAHALRRIAMTLSRWHELECGDSHDDMSWSIERDGDEKDSKPFMVYHYGKPLHWRVSFPGQDAKSARKRFFAKIDAEKYVSEISPDSVPEVKAVYTRREKIADRESGALRRLAVIMSRYPTLKSYVQGDPRGASLYILRPVDIREGAEIDSYYSNGIAVYK